MNAASSVVKHFFQAQRLVLLLFIGFASVASAKEALTLPQNCVESCVTPYGAVLGMTSEGTKSFSNCQSSCVVFDPNQENGTYTGIKWQCVEFARRWLIRNRGLTFGDVDVAADIWSINAFTRLSDQSQVPVQSYLNGSNTQPMPGDLLIYAKEYLATGHAAVVLGVDLKKGRVRVAEQNFNNQKWSGHYARSIELIHKNGHYWLLDAYLLGWKRAQ